MQQKHTYFKYDDRKIHNITTQYQYRLSVKNLTVILYFKEIQPTTTKLST